MKTIPFRPYTCRSRSAHARFGAAIFSTLAMVGGSQAQFSLSFDYFQTVGVPGSETITLTANSSAGPITAIDAFFGGRTLGQVNPLDMPTVFYDLNGFFGDNHPSEDSQFQFFSSNVIIESASESDTHLEASFSSPDDEGFGTSVDVAQIALPDGFDGSACFNISVVIDDVVYSENNYFFLVPDGPLLDGCFDPVMDADFNDDGAVDLLDLDILGGFWMSYVTVADANGDHFVNLVDLDILGQQWTDASSFEEALAASGISVPEPAGIVMVMAGAAVAVQRRRQF